MPFTRIAACLDPLVRLLLLAILLATFLPVTGEGRVIARAVSDAAIFALFLLNGLRLPRAQVLQGIGNLRLLLPLVLWCFGAMALAGWGLFRMGEGLLPPLVALGFLYLGTMPSTVQSATAYSSLAGGNVAASVVAAAVLNIIGVFISAALFSLIAGGNAPGLDLAGLQRLGLILLLPFALGQLLQTRCGGWVQARKGLVGWFDRGSIAIAVYVAFSGAVEQGLWNRMEPGNWAALLGLVGLFLAFGFGGAWVAGKAAGLARAERITFLFSGGQKSIAIGAPLAAVLFPPEVAGLLLLPLLAYHLLQLVLSAPLAARLARHSG